MRKEEQPIVERDFAETLNFYISNTEDGIGSMPRAKLVEIKTTIEALQTEIERLKGERDRFEAKKISLQDDAIPSLIYRAETAEKKVQELTAALAESDRHSEKVEVLLDPHVSWGGQPPQAQTTAESEASALRKRVEELTEMLRMTDAALGKCADIIVGYPDHDISVAANVEWTRRHARTLTEGGKDG